METLTPFVEHALANLPNETHGLAQADAAAVSAGWESKCLPCRQKNAADFLAGGMPGVIAFYAPDADAAPDGEPQGEAESSETVQRLLEWREQAPYG